MPHPSIILFFRNSLCLFQAGAIGKKDRALPCCHSLLDVSEEAAVEFVDRVQVGEEQAQEVFGQLLLFADLITEPLESESVLKVGVKVVAKRLARLPHDGEVKGLSRYDNFSNTSVELYKRTRIES